jgi:hypothetical protein
VKPLLIVILLICRVPGGARAQFLSDWVMASIALSDGELFSRCY